MRWPKRKQPRKGLTTGQNMRNRRGVKVPRVAAQPVGMKSRTKPPVVSEPGAYIGPKRPKEKDIPSGSMPLTSKQMKDVGGQVYSVETGKRPVPADWWLKQRALGRGKVVRAPGIRPEPGEPSEELTEGEKVRRKAYGERRLYLETPEGALLTEERIPEGGTERGAAVRRMAEERGISIPEASRLYDAERREARRAERNRKRDIRRLARRAGITLGEATARYDSQYGAPGPARPAATDWSGPPTMTGTFGEEGTMGIPAGEIPREEPEPATPREAMEAQFSEFAKPLQTGHMTWRDFALQIDPAAAAGERADDPTVAKQIKEVNYLRDAILNGSAPPEEAGRKIMRLMREFASHEPFEDAVSEAEALENLQDFDMADWVPAGELDPADRQRVNAMAEQILERVADGDMTATEGWEKLRDLVDTFAEMEPTEVEEPEAEWGAEPEKVDTQMAKVIEGLLGHEAKLGEEGPTMTGEDKKEYGWNYPGGAVKHGIWIEKGEVVDGKKVKRGYWREPTEEEIAERLEARYDNFVDAFTAFGKSREAIEANWRLGLYQYDFMQIWEKHHAAEEAEDSVGSVERRLEAGEDPAIVLSAYPPGTFTDEEMQRFARGARGAE